jgi:hypothetical protein
MDRGNRFRRATEEMPNRVAPGRHEQRRAVHWLMLRKTQAPGVRFVLPMAEAEEISRLKPAGEESIW